MFITGGCCHDYGNQSGIIAKGVSARANITFDVKYQGGTDRNVKIPSTKRKIGPRRTTSSFTTNVSAV